MREVAQRLIAKIPEVEDALAAEHNLQAPHVERAFDWDVNVLQSDQVNAFCLPGGKIAVYTGLIPVAQNADAMAIVLGHEISHALLRHGAQRMTEQKLAQIGQMAGAASGMDQQQMQAVMAVYGYGRALPYARKQETQADEMGLMLAAAACYNPQEAIPLWQRMDEASGGERPARIRIDPPQSRHAHPEPAGAHAQGEAYRQRFCNAVRRTAGGADKRAADQKLMNNPPLTGMFAPVMNPASSAVRNSTVRAISSGRPSRPTGTLATMPARMSSGIDITIAVSQ